MRFFSTLLLILGSTLIGLASFAQENLTLGEKLNFTASCQLKTSSRRYYLNQCPNGMVMVGANPLAGNPNAIQVLCVSLEVACEGLR